MHLDELTTLILELRQEGSDTESVEVKQASGGFPDSLTPTLSAFANKPGGGLVIFGLDEKAGFKAVGVYDVAACKAILATRARTAVTPPITFEAWDFELSGAAVVVARIHELDAHGKPCRVVSTGKAFLRSYDGDYRLSQVEEQAFIANRSTPTFDQQAVPGTTTADLSADLLTSYLASCRSSRALTKLDDDQILYRTGVTIGDERSLSFAGLLALGIYPQQHFPNCVIQASVAPRGSDPPGTRASEPFRVTVGGCV